MSKKKIKIDKETRKIIEAVSDRIKRKDGVYKIKTKNKKIRKQILRVCTHWVSTKNGEHPAVVRDPDDSSYWICTICGAKFPVPPLEVEKYEEAVDTLMSYVNQMQLYSVKMGGDEEDTKILQNLKRDLPKFKKLSKNIVKHINEREKFEKNKNNSDATSQFNAYGSWSFKA